MFGEMIDRALDLRFDRRWTFSRLQVITYLDIQDVYNRNNPIGYYWDKRKLKPTVLTDASLIGGVRVTVGDEVLDTSVRARLASMQTALCA